MASIRKRGQRWQVQIRRKNQPPKAKSFLQQSDARKWATQMERLVDIGQLRTCAFETATLSDLLEKYLNQVTCNKRGSDKETYLIRRLQSGPLGNLMIKGLSAQPFAGYRDHRLETVSAGTGHWRLRWSPFYRWIQFQCHYVGDSLSSRCGLQSLDIIYESIFQRSHGQ